MGLFLLKSWRLLLLVAACCTAAIPAARASVMTATFSGTSNGGTGSAILMFDDTNSTQLTITIDNTSPNRLNNGTGVNSAAITGWGFSTTPNLPSVTSWSVTAGNGVDLSSRYGMSFNTGFGGAGGGVQVEELISTNNGINGGIYNAAAPGNIANLYPDIAVFRINFAVPFSLAQLDTATLRMQRVGSGGSGSLKLLGLVAAQTAVRVPEPSAALILGVGLLGMAVRRRIKKTDSDGGSA